MELTGRVTANAVVSTTRSGKEVVEFSLALNDYYKPKGATESLQVTQYVACDYWKNTAIAGRLLRGSIVEVSGRISVQPYIGKDGTAKASLNMHCNTVKVHSSNSTKVTDVATRNEAVPEEKKEINSVASITEPMDDLPF